MNCKLTPQAFGRRKIKAKTVQLDLTLRKGRQKKRWEDNISEWTRLGLGEALRKAEDRD